MRVRAFQVVLSILSGYVDAVGFHVLPGTYVAFMSGNSTLLGIAAMETVADSAAVAGGLVGCFVAGVMAGTLLGGGLARWRPVGVMLLGAGLLAGAALLASVRSPVFGAMVLAGAMGVVNTSFNRPGASGVGLTYMTGTLVRIGQQLSAALRGGHWAAVLPDALLWAGLVGGAALGTGAFRVMGMETLWLAAGALLALAGAARLVLPAAPKAS